MRRFAYADPPYVGQARRHYGREEVDHRALIAQLEMYDGWALSCSSPSLQTLLPALPSQGAGSGLGEAVRLVQARRQSGLRMGAGPIRGESKARPGRADGAGLGERQYYASEGAARGEAGSLLHVAIPSPRHETRRHLRRPVPRNLRRE